MKVRFNQDVDVGDGQTFTQGKVYDLNDASAYRWIRRRKAEQVGKVDKTPPVETAALSPVTETAEPARATAKKVG